MEQFLVVKTLLLVEWQQAVTQEEAREVDEMGVAALIVEQMEGGGE